MSCPHLPELWKLCDGELDSTRASAVRAHVATCPVCRKEQQELERLASLLQSGDVTTPPPHRHQERRRALLERCARSLTGETPSARRPLISRSPAWTEW